MKIYKVSLRIDEMGCAGKHHTLHFQIVSDERHIQGIIQLTMHAAIMGMSQQARGHRTHRGRFNPFPPCCLPDADEQYTTITCIGDVKSSHYEVLYQPDPEKDFMTDVTLIVDSYCGSLDQYFSRR